MKKKALKREIDRLNAILSQSLSVIYDGDEMLNVNLLTLHLVVKYGTSLYNNQILTLYLPSEKILQLRLVK